MFRTAYRTIIYLIVLLLFSPILLPALIAGLFWGAVGVGFKVGCNLLVHFLLTYKTNRYETAANGLPNGVAFAGRRGKHRR